MDLALELGMTVAQLKRSMLSSELADWYAYAGKKLLPTRRIEHYLAQIAQAFAGGALGDYLLIDPPEAPPLAAEEGASALAAIAGGPGVRVLGQKKRKRKT